jgi:3-deoxy-D-manno-octulosonate 8-phosphate phosphatase KdsC-like HAD superfamily phosphatase
MKVCGYTACPIDSHLKIKEISKYILTTKGGDGVVRELLEQVFNLDFIKILYSNQGIKR